MKNLPAGLVKSLHTDFLFPRCSPVGKNVSSDGTTKFLFSLHDNEKSEAVLIPASGRTTVCVSTQVGCKFRCRFCASGIAGWIRNLSCAEIIAQILSIRRHPNTQSVTHIVFMGIGEPFDNYDNLIKAIRIINSPHGMNIAARRITVSTCGLIDGIDRLKKEGMQIELAVSLHGSNNELRNKLMPVGRKYPLNDLIKTCKEYIKTTKRQVTFEYLLIRDITCANRAAEELGRLLKGMTCKLNLIPYNAVDEFSYRPPKKIEILSFRNRLKQLGIHATVRLPRGNDISAACGQLRHVKEKNASR